MMETEAINILLGFVLGWLTLTLVFFLYRFVRNRWRSRRYGPSIDHGLLLVAHGRRLANAANQDILAQIMTKELPAELGVSRSVLMLPKGYQLITIGNDNLSLPINHAAIRWVASSGEAQRSDLKRLNELINQGMADLSWTRVWVPLMRGAHLNGMWLLGERDTGVHYSPEDLQWLNSLAREAAAVLEAIHFAKQESQAASEIRALYRQVIAAREAERERLSHEIHDGVLQDLCAVARDLKALETKSHIKDEAYAPLVSFTDSTIQALRAICYDLRPPLLQQDLASALKALVEDMDARSPAPVHIEISILHDELRLPDDFALAIFRITQEALNNALQYANASEIAVRLTEYPDNLRLTVTDDGEGINGDLDSASYVANGCYGVAGMRERAAMVGGKLEVQTSLGYGTVVILDLPC